MAPTHTNAARRRDARRLLLRYHHTGDAAAREALVRQFLPLARHLARRYQHGGEPIDDLIQVASLGLLKAIDRYDPARGVTLPSFATPTILGELKRHFRDHGWAVRVPRDLQERAALTDQAAEALSRELGRPPTAAQIADRTDMTAEQVLEARQAGSARRALPLDARMDDSERESLADNLGVEDPGFLLAEQAATLSRLMRVLDERDRQILRLRFADELLQREIAERVGVSQMQVSRLIRQAVARLQEAAETGGADRAVPGTPQRE